MGQVDTYQVRNDSYYKIYDSLSNKRKETYDLISKNEPCTAQELSGNYRLPINSIIGRFTELKYRGLIIPIGIKTNYSTGFGNTFYRVTTEAEGIEIRKKRFVELRDMKDNLINDFNLGLSTLTKYVIQKELNKINIKIKSLEEWN